MYYVFIIFTIIIISIKVSLIYNLLTHIKLTKKIVEDRVIIKDFKQKKIKYIDMFLDVFVIFSLCYLAKYEYQSTLLYYISFSYFFISLIHYYYLNKYINITKKIKQNNF